MEKAQLSHPPLKARHAYDGFQFALVAKKLVIATQYIEQAYNAKLTLEGKHSPETKQMLYLKNNPTSHYLFRGWK